MSENDFDVFNGDADGICALVQMRLAQPRSATLISGVKRDIALLEQVCAEQVGRVTVLDVSMRSNIVALEKLLSCGAEIFYADHHNAGDIPEHPRLKALIDTSSETCTALIVDDYLNGGYRAWAVTAAFGDNFPVQARMKAKSLGLEDAVVDRLERLGILINYNGYGASVADLHFAPDELFRQCVAFNTPMAFMAENAEVFEKLEQGYEADMQHAASAEYLAESEKFSVLVLPNASASRRVSGVYGNSLAQEQTHRAHAILTDKGDDAFLVSVRAPLDRREGADTLCIQFETGGGRSAAAGINHLPASDLERFVNAFTGLYG